MTIWYEDPGFWSGTSEFMFDEDRWNSADAEVDGAVALLGVEPGAHVLDLCCGPGRHARALLARGLQVTGVDLQGAHVREARRRAPGIEAVEADMREFRRDAAFDGAINLFTSFGYFDDIADDLRVAENLHASLIPGARCIIETKGKENLARQFEPVACHELKDGTILTERREILGAWERCRCTFTRQLADGTVDYQFVTRLYAATELRALLQDAGFAQVEFYGSLDGAPYDHEAQRMVAVAIKA